MNRINGRQMLKILPALIAVAFLMNPAPANADPISDAFSGALKGVLSLSLGLVFNVLGTLTGEVLAVAVIFFNWVSSSNFISLSYTNPAGNEFIRVGWTLTRDLTNIVFIAAMIAIGIGTTLRIGGYQAQKVLPTLILVALLINFTPVFTGLIVDGSNIIMGFFINPEGSNAAQIIVAKSTEHWKNIGTLFGSVKFWDPIATDEGVAAAVSSFFLIFFNIIAAIIYFAYGLVLLIRYVAIWLLVILSPFAFACYVLPATRGYFTQWWKMFIQWSTIGIIMGFFLYLSEHLTRIVASPQFFQSTTANNTATAGFALAGILPYFMPIILLFIGLMASLAGAPAGARGIIQGSQRLTNFVARNAPSVTWRGAKGMAMAPVKAIGRYQAARAGGLAGGQALGEAVFGPGGPKGAWGRWRPPLPGTPAGPQMKAAASGLKKAAGDIWGVALGKGKRKRPKATRRCPDCGKYTDVDYTHCQFCPHIF